jgi:putative ABC transport system permease protein
MNERIHSPRVIHFLLRVVLPKADRDRLIGELEEDFRQCALPRWGRRRARRWYRREGATLLKSYALAHLVPGRTRDLSVLLAARRLWRHALDDPDAFRRREGRLEGLGYDLRYALRALCRQPGFLAAAVVTLALGIGATTALYSVLHGVVLKPLPFPEAERLVRIYHDPIQMISGPDIVTFRERVRSLEAVASFYDYSDSGFDLSGDGRPQRVSAMPVSAEYFGVLKVAPVLGRTFTREEERAGTGVVMLNSALWKDRWPTAPDTLGQSVVLDGVSYTVIGVLPVGFREPFGRHIDIWIPQNLEPGGANTPDHYYLSMLGRLRPGVSLSEAQAEFDAIVASLEADSPRGEPWRMSLVPLAEAVIGPTGQLLFVLLAASALVLLVACVNVANLFLARGTGRGQEFAVRSALGSGRGRLARQLLLESLLTALLGGLLGLGLAGGGEQALLALRPDVLPRIDEILFDGNVFAFAAGITLLTVVFFGIVPVLRYSHPQMGQILKDSGRLGSGLKHRHLLRILVITQQGLAGILLIGAALLVRSYVLLNRVDPGCLTRNVLTFDVNLPRSRYPAEDPNRRIAFYEQFQQRISSLPGVVACGAVTRLPLTGSFNSWGHLVLREYEATGQQVWHGDNIRIVFGDYFRALGIPVLNGRIFTAEDGPESPPVMVVNRTLADRHFPDSPAVGQKIWREPWREVIGVVGDTRVGYRQETPLMIYIPYQQLTRDSWSLTQVVRADHDVSLLVPHLRRELSELDPDLVLYDVRTMEEIAAGGMARERFTMQLLTLFAVTALILALVGVYGVFSYAVSRRQHEIGVRMALGVTGQQLRRLVIREGMALTSISILASLAAAALLTHWLESLVFGISVQDPLAFAAVAILIGSTDWLACWLPACRTTRVDPVRVLNRI